MKFLLIDFGATNIKTAIVDLINGKITNIQKFLSPQSTDNSQYKFEISINELKNSLLMICNLYYNNYCIKFDGISLCSQMHGFVVLNEKLIPKTNYISWKDERSLHEVDGLMTFDFSSKKLQGMFKKITGMTPRPNIPFFNIIHLARDKMLNMGDIIVSLPTYLSLSLGNRELIEHDTLLAGLGFYDLCKKAVSDELNDFFYELTKIKLRLGNSAGLGETLGYWSFLGKKIPIYVGVGDHQAALLGAGVWSDEYLSINLGTGSQVSCLTDSIDANIDSQPYDCRPYFDGWYLNTITHIPSGRVLNEFLSLIKDISDHLGDSKNNFDPWQYILSLTDDEIIFSTLKFNLSIFNGAWRYTSGGSINNIKPDTFNLRNYFASLIRSYIEQYIDASKIFSTNKEQHRYVFSGGIAQKLPSITRLYSKLTNCESIQPLKYDETLFGLRAMSLVHSKIESSCKAAFFHRYANQ